MKSFFVICFLAIFAIRSDEDINWSKVRSKHIDISSMIKIIGGEEAAPHSFPYQVGLYLAKSEKEYAWCGGSLISTEYVLTAAHCVVKIEEGFVLLGAHNISEQSDGQVNIKVFKTNFIIHEKWASCYIDNDIALIKLPNPVELTQNIQLLHLPHRSLADLAGKLVTATGWGYISDNPPGISAVLRYAELKVMPQEECKTYFQHLLKKTNVCTSGEDGKSPCFGDSGGPIVIQLDGSRTIVGLASFTYSRCEAGWPTAFTRITSYLDWISSHTGLPIKD